MYTFFFLFNFAFSCSRRVISVPHVGDANGGSRQCRVLWVDYHLSRRGGATPGSGCHPLCLAPGRTVPSPEIAAGTVKCGFCFQQSFFSVLPCEWLSTSAEEAAEIHGCLASGNTKCRQSSGKRMEQIAASHSSCASWTPRAVSEPKASRLARQLRPRSRGSFATRETGQP